MKHMCASDIPFTVEGAIVTVGSTKNLDIGKGYYEYRWSVLEMKVFVLRPGFLSILLIFRPQVAALYSWSAHVQV